MNTKYALYILEAVALLLPLAKKLLEESAEA